MVALKRIVGGEIDLHVFVTGGAGYIGSHVLLQLHDAGHEATTFDNLVTGRRDAVLHGNFVEGDITNADSLTAALTECRPDAVIHLAALSDLRESIIQPVKYHRNNTVGTLNVVNACQQARVEKIVFSSSAAVYGASQADTIPETDPVEPISPYGTSKHMGEIILDDVAEASGLRHVNLRFFNVAGADAKGRAGESTSEAWHLIKIACQAATGKRDGMVIYGDGYPTPDGTCIRDYVHVDDIARAHINALKFMSAEGKSETLNVGYGHGVSVREVIDMVKQVSGVDFPVTVGAARPGDPARLVADSSRSRDVLGWQPECDNLETIVGSAMAWERRLKKRSHRA